MNPVSDYLQQQTRRYFFGRSAAGIGTAALASLLNPSLMASDASVALPVLHHRPTAKRVIWLFMADAPSQLDLYDYKPTLNDFFDKDLPESVRNGQPSRP